MSQEKRNLELTWNDEEDLALREPRICLEVFDDGQPEAPPRVRMEAALQICCAPRCDCSGIRFKWLPAAEDLPTDPVPDFWFDSDEGTIRLTPELEKDPKVLEMGRIFDEELTTPMRKELRTWFLARKLAIIQSTPVDDFDISNLPDATGGQMVGFIDVFPCGLALYSTPNDEMWTVDEQYCVQFGCRCNATVLSFIKLEDSDGNRPAATRDHPTIRYDYGSRATSTVDRGPAGSPDTRSLMRELRKQIPDFDIQLELRHAILRALYRRSELAALEARLEASQNQAPKIGRNAPCPCGSGRKFKQCCLNKPAG